MNLNADFRLVGTSEKMREVQEQLKKVAPTNYSVLIVGETGVGKEIAARYIHRMSKRGSTPFLGFNCSNLTNEMAGSELFGHERGSFTNAYMRKIGLFERVNRGTLFLDEVETLRPEVQARFLRFLETGKFERLGGMAELSADVRVISGTSYELYDSPDFRQDLYYRLNEFRINIPPLREHMEDILELAGFYLALLNASNGRERTLGAGAYDALMEYRFPGNVRELINVLKRAHLFANNYRIDGNTIRYVIKELNHPVKTGQYDSIKELTEGTIKYFIRKPRTGDVSQETAITESGLQLDVVLPWRREDACREFYKAYLAAVFKAADGNLLSARKLMDTPRSTVDNLIKRLGYKSIFDFCRENGLASNRYDYRVRQSGRRGYSPVENQILPTIDSVAGDATCPEVRNADKSDDNPEKGKLCEGEEKWINALRTYNGSVMEAARSLNTRPYTLYNGIKEWGYASMHAFRIAHGIKCRPARLSPLSRSR